MRRILTTHIQDRFTFTRTGITATIIIGITGAN
jgi:hypothetical protein